MSSALQLPNATQVGAQLTRLLRRKVEAVAGSPPKGTLQFAGAYRGSDGALLGVCLADIGFAGRAAAAFALIPAEAAEEAVRSRTLDDNLRETFGEVLNVASRLFLARDGARVTLREMHLPPQSCAPELLQGEATALRIDIDGYGQGWLALRLAS
jgi:hypothetical protein